MNESFADFSDGRWASVPTPIGVDSRSVRNELRRMDYADFEGLLQAPAGLSHTSGRPG